MLGLEPTDQIFITYIFSALVTSFWMSRLKQSHHHAVLDACRVSGSDRGPNVYRARMGWLGCSDLNALTPNPSPLQVALEALAKMTAQRKYALQLNLKHIPSVAQDEGQKQRR